MRNGSFASILPGALILACLALLLGGCDGAQAFMSPEVARQQAQRDAEQLIAIAIGPPEARIPSGSNIRLTATGILHNGTRQDITSRVSWASSSPTVASIANRPETPGSTTAGSVGSTTITASLDGISATTSLTVTQATPVSVSVTPAVLTLAPGTTQQFTATAEYTDRTTHDVTSEAMWHSSDPTVASVSNDAGTSGRLSALQAGSAIITATLGDIAHTSALTVTGASLRSIEITPPAPGIAKGLSIQFTATGVFSDNSTQDLTALANWTTGDASIGAIDNTPAHRGRATGAGVGTTQITASFGAMSAVTPLTVTSATLVSLSITPTDPLLARGVTNHFTATGVYSDQSTMDLTTTAIWSSSDGSVLSVSNALGFEGQATALSPGSTTVAATAGGISATTSATVTSASLVTISVTPATPSITNGLTRQFTAMGIYSDLSTQDLTDDVTWGSSNPAVGTISNAAASHGLLSTVNAGTTTVSATLGSVAGQTTATVTAATLVSIAVTPHAGALNLGYSRQFTATGTYTDLSTQDLTSVATWSSSLTAIATISNAAGTRGLADSHALGTTVIRATYGGVISTDLSLVVSAPAIVSIVVTPATPAIASGTTLQLVGSFRYSDNSTTVETANLTWSTSDSNVATVRNTAPVGRVSAVAPGSVTITASAAGVPSGSTTITVTAATLVSIAVTPAITSIVNGTQKQFSATGTYTDNSTQNLTAAATWSSSDTNVASIANSAGTQGLATSAGVGSTSISATVGSVVSPTATLMVTSSTSYTYILNQDVDSISSYRIDTGGALTALGTVATGDLPFSMAIDPLNRFAYVVNQNADTVSLFTIAANGTLTPNGTTSTGPTPIACAVDPSAQYFFVANFADNSISQYRIGVGGTLTANGVVSTGSAPYSLVADPLGRHLYVANFIDDTISQFAIGTNGTLTVLRTVPTDVMPSAIALDPAGRFLYTANFQSGNVSQFAIGAGGTLSSLGTAVAGAGATSLAVDPTSRYLYVANYLDSTISEFTIGAGGALTPLDTIASGANPYSVDVDPSGRYVYTADSADNTATRYTISVDGSLAPAGTTSTGAYPFSVVTSN